MIFFILSDHYQGHSDLHVKLSGLPRTATPADITRLLGRNKVHNIAKGNCEVSAVPLAPLTYWRSRARVSPIRAHWSRFPHALPAVCPIKGPSGSQGPEAFWASIDASDHPAPHQNQYALARSKRARRGF